MTEGYTIYYGNVWFYSESTIKTKQGNFLSILRFIITEQSGQWANWTFSVILHIYLLKFEPRKSCWQTSVMYYSSNSPSRRKIETSYWNCSSFPSNQNISWIKHVNHKGLYVAHNVDWIWHPFLYQSVKNVTWDFSHILIVANILC